MFYIVQGRANFIEKGPEMGFFNDDHGLGRGTADDIGQLLFGEGTGVSISAGDKGLRFLLVSGKPIGEPIAWRGPIVMTTDKELDQAFAEYRNGTFLRFED